MNILLATGEADLDGVIQELMPKANFVGDIYYREGVVEMVRLHHPDVIIMSELLDGTDIAMTDLLLTLRFQFDRVRIVFLLKEDNPDMKRFLYDYHIFDVLATSFTIDDLEELLQKPRTWDDVKDEIAVLQKLKNTKGKSADKPDITTLTGINPSTYSPFGDEFNKGGAVQHEIVPFWSVLDQAGKTISAVNTALTLANNPNLKILLLDFNLTNPSTSLYYNFVDANHNLAALIEDYENNQDETLDSLSSYFITHPVFSNLSILPGYLLRRDPPSQEVSIEIFNHLLKEAKYLGYTTVLIDMESSIRSPLQIQILQHATKILLHLNETPGTYNALDRLFDDLYGSFRKNLISKEKIIPVITQSFDDTFPSFKLEIEKFFEKHVFLYFEHSNEMRLSAFNGVPIMRELPPENLYEKFVLLSNLIHENSFIKPIKPKKGKSDKKGKGGFFWKRK